VPHEEENQGRSTAVNKNLAMDDVRKKLQTMIDYWIEHNAEHEKELRDWAEKAASSSAKVAQQLQKAASKMAEATDELLKAKQALSNSEGRH
jgi:DNA polymerase sigma